MPDFVPPFMSSGLTFVLLTYDNILNSLTKFNDSNVTRSIIFCDCSFVSALPDLELEAAISVTITDSFTYKIRAALCSHLVVRRLVHSRRRLPTRL